MPPREYFEGTSYIKVPIGVIPKKLWIEQRIEDLKQTIYRYLDANLPVPHAWYEELEEHIKGLRK